MRRRVAILGSTGSIGTQAMAVIAQHPDIFELVGISAGSNVDLLLQQQAQHQVRAVSIAEPRVAHRLQDVLGPEVRVAAGRDGLRMVAAETGADVVLVATDGAVSFEAAFAAVECGIDLAVANKELIVAAGELLIALARKHNVRILPVDSEHSALFQCLVGEPDASVARLILTASGGPFRSWTWAQIDGATPAEAMAHPTWSMGIKNSIDSATLMNKGLEVIEAGRLFDLPGERIDVLVHPTSLVHGFVVFKDGSIKAQLAAPDMRIPIGYALAYPNRLVEPDLTASLDPLTYLAADARTQLEHVGEQAAVNLRFERVDHHRFPALGLAYQALKAGGTCPCALSAANEIAVEEFYRGNIGFRHIAETVAAVLHNLPCLELSLATLSDIDTRARAEAYAYIERSCTAA